MKFISQIKFKSLILACVASFFAIFFISIQVFASTIENFDSYNLGDIDGQGNWTVTGTAEGTVNNSEFITLPNSLKFSSDSNLGGDYIQFDNTATSTEIWYMRMKIDTGGTNVTCVSFLNASSSIHSWFCAEADGSLYINGLDSTKNVNDEEWHLITFETSATSSRIKVDSGNFSSWKEYAVTPKVTEYVRFSTQDSANYSYLDDFGNTGGSFEDNIENLVITELEDVDDINIQIQAENFLFDDEVYCFYDVSTTTYPCKINYYYNPDYVGYYVLLLEDTATSVLDFLELDILEDIDLMKGNLLPIERTQETTDGYNIFIYDPEDTGTSTYELFGPINVYWISSSTDDVINVPHIFDFFKKTFPLSIILQLRDFFNNYREQPENYQELVIPFNMFIATSTGYTVSGNVFEASWVQEKISWYDDVIIYIQNFLLVIICLLIVIKQTRMIFGNSEE